MRDTDYDVSWPPVVDVLEHYFGYEHTPRRQFKWAAVRCPFHGDSHASASVNAEGGIFFCHACGVSISGLGIVMREEETDVDGARRIAEGLFGGSDQLLREESGSSGDLAGRPRHTPRPRKRIPIGRRRRAVLGT
jgi:hypothetical protein